ncbi:transport and Golgi organization protein 2 homolog [Anthonomus grandis grandis]|uniref:transport and Golgi organization protein 2 homolog n=1 Tax=Anthonomus grandis grandis TaxID=2921223 RepID=UPI0021655264|nr:transport and Golgi organization protein 2 homolog [Anthonomus grandis grandis]
MCILFLHTNPDPQDNEYRLIVATNRDEYYTRPAKAAYKCPETGVIAGRDMEPGREYGSWLGCTIKNELDNELTEGKKFCFSCLTNISGNNKVPNAAGRGELVIKYLEGTATFPEYIDKLKNTDVSFNGFNLIGVELSKGGLTRTYHSCNQPEIDSVYTGKHTIGFGNSTISSPYMKVLNGRNRFQEIIERNLDKDQLKAELLALLKDKTQHLPDEELARRSPVGLQVLSSIYVEYLSAGYGTRTHTIVLLDKEWNMEFIEFTMQEPIIDPRHPEWHQTVIKSSL